MDGVNNKALGIVEDDMGDGMQCNEHPYTKNPGGICAFCLQEKLGKLVTSSLPLPITKISSSSSSSSPSFRSDIASSSTSVRPRYENPNPSGYNNQYCTRRPKPKCPFYLVKCNNNNKKKKDGGGHFMYGRTRSSNSSAMPKTRLFLDEDSNYSPRKKTGFWSFLYFSSPSSKSESFKSCTTNGSGSKVVKVKSSESRGSIVENNNEDGDCTPNSQVERKVSRSRSVGCGSRSFSGDFFERISNGFGDCTLRRVESQREGKAAKNSRHHAAAVAAASSSMKERVKCGGLFGGFMVMNSFSSSSSSSSSYWASTTSSSEEVSRKIGTRQHHHHQLVHGRSRSWSWGAFASPMRAFNRPSSSSKRGHANINLNLNGIKKEAIASSSSSSSNPNINPTPNLNAVPSLLTVGG